MDADCVIRKHLYYFFCLQPCIESFMNIHILPDLFFRAYVYAPVWAICEYSYNVYLFISVLCDTSR